MLLLGRDIDPGVHSSSGGLRRRPHTGAAVPPRLQYVSFEVSSFKRRTLELTAGACAGRFASMGAGNTAARPCNAPLAVCESPQHSAT